MTEEQIKAIAEEYATSDGVTNEIVSDICQAFLYRLKDCYCIVEKEKVMEKYNAIKFLNQVGCQDRLDLMEDLFGTSMFKPKEAEYTAQCETCMRKLAGEVLEVCKNSTDPNRHCQWYSSKTQDFCAYKIFWDRYPESHWQTILSPEQFAKAKSLNQNKDK
ncbi:MAG: hypothetical protein NC548_34655 [Lachnospiraceae bacterium]|nr:hypothetical protein [Lachnospiraceae bacterium]